MIEVQVRPQVVATYDERLAPVLRREPLYQAENNHSMGFATSHLFGLIPAR
jgi:hypothetical protein